ncbi:hypothetical protein [Paraburkholderia azotifigens]|uniref:hypothetical protein n=1 Tax=Paraburkholderia azotifigens TaxID=2057004 RepID=UPI001EFFA3EC|nr:hypothetical protein [Paraburkholderia azotifigens]
MKASAKDSAQIASIFATRSFQFLVNAVGAENIAIALESNMGRVAELLKGERFTPETAFHMETTLGLPHGFFDQPNPALTEETIARLKSPLDFVQINEAVDAESEAPAPPAAKTANQAAASAVSVSEETQMPKKVAGGSAGTVKNSQSAMTKQQLKTRGPRKDSTTKDAASTKALQQRPLALNDSGEVENIRRTNLHLLTSRNGSKVRLGVIMDMSGFNIADRLHGKKRMDSVETNRFTERLGLPVGWLDSPRTEAEIPESVSVMLAPAPRARARASVKQDTPPAPVTDGIQRKPISQEARTRRKRSTTMGDSKHPSPVPAHVGEQRETTIASSEAPVNDLAVDLASRLSAGSHAEAPVAPAVPAGSMPAAAPSHQDLPPVPFTSSTSLDNLQGIAPIAEALIKTLAGKARTGRLDELKALELLQQAILL